MERLFRFLAALGFGRTIRRVGICSRCGSSIELVILLALTCPLAAKPVPKNLPKALPAIAGECSYGIITQTGRLVTIAGGSSWVARGKVRDDEKIELAWTSLDSGRDAVGVYTFTGGRIVGVWAWADEEVIDERGELAGRLVRQESIAITSERDWQ